MLTIIVSLTPHGWAFAIAAGVWWIIGALSHFYWIRRWNDSFLLLDLCLMCPMGLLGPLVYVLYWFADILLGAAENDIGGPW